jgi:hypothetical protein
MKRFGQVFIGARLQAAYNLGFFGDARKQDDICGGLAEIRADALAQLNPGQVGHQPVGNHKAGPMLGEKSESLAAGLRDDKLKLVGRKSVLQKLAGDRRIVHRKNGEGFISVVQFFIVLEIKPKTTRPAFSCAGERGTTTSTHKTNSAMAPLNRRISMSHLKL